MEANLQKSLDLIDELLKTYDKNELLLTLKIYDHLKEDEEFIISSIIYSLENLKNKNKLLNQYTNLTNLLNLNHLDIYNNILKEVNIEKLEVISIISLLRLSYLFRKDLSEWYVFLNKSITELNNRKLNTNQILIGLI